MRLAEASVNGSGQAVREALARKSDWEHHGPSQWGYGVAIDLLALERRVSALERFSGAGKSAGEDNDSPGEGWRWVREGERGQEGDEWLSADWKAWRPSTWRGPAPPRTYRRRIDARSNHDAAPAARAQLPEADHAACRSRESDAGTGGTTASACDGAVSPSGSGSGGSLSRSAPERQSPASECGGGEPLDDCAPTRDNAPGGRGRGTQEPVAFAVMSGGRSYDIYDTRGEAEAICRWLCDEESGDIWRVVPLVPDDATPESHATHGEYRVHPCGSEPVAWAVENPAGDINTIAYRRDRAEDHLRSASERVVPLYRQPALTAEECEAIELAAYDYLYHRDPGGRAQWIREQLLGLLARTK